MHYYKPKVCTIVSWKERPPSERVPTPYFCCFLYRIKVYLNERPPWSKLRMANVVYLWSLRSTATSAMLSEVRNFVLYFTEGYYKAALCRWMYLRWCAPQATPCAWWLGAVQSVVVLSALDIEATGSSILRYCLSNYLLRGHRVAVNMTLALFHG